MKTKAHSRQQGRKEGKREVSLQRMLVVISCESDGKGMGIRMVGKS
jgi:hypothetical protein